MQNVIEEDQREIKKELLRLKQELKLIFKPITRGKEHKEI